MTDNSPFTLLAHLHMQRAYHADRIEYVDPEVDVPGREVDIPKLRAGGVNCIWLSLGAPGEFTVDPEIAFASREEPNDKPAKRTVYHGPAGVQRVLRGFGAIKKLCRDRPELELVTTTEEARRAVGAGRIAVFLHTEHLLFGNDLSMLEIYHDVGLRATGLIHASIDSWVDCDKEQRSPGGLTDLGRDVIGELNRLGIVIDLSHASEQAIRDVAAASRAPICVSHANVRAISPLMRNLSERTIREVADSGGVIGIHCSSAFIDLECLRGRTAGAGRDPSIRDQRFAVLEAIRRGEVDPFAQEAAFKSGAEQPLFSTMPTTTLERLVDHIDALVDQAGIDHVGIGTDLQGLGDAVKGFESAAGAVNFLEALRTRGYDEASVAKIAGGNFMRLMHEVID